MATYIMSDIHGEADLFHSMLQRIGFTPEDTLYLLGDVIDRGPDGIQLLREIMHTPNMKMILGNHEYMMMQYYSPEATDVAGLRWSRNGNAPTVAAFESLQAEEQTEILDYLKNLPTHAESCPGGKSFYLVHGFPSENVHEVEILRRMEEGIYNEEEYQQALAWTKEHCKEGRDDNPEEVEFLGETVRIKFTPEEKEKQWEFTVKMYCIIKDLMAGNPNLPDAFEEEKVGHNAIAGGFQGQRQWTDHWPNCDYPEALLSSSFDYEGAREPFTLATENDILNGMSMLMMRLLTHRAQIFADVRTYWSGEATERVTGYKLEGKAAESNGIIHLLNSGAACLDASGVCTDENGNATMKRWWDVTEEDIKKMTDATVWCEAGQDNFRGGGFSSHYTTKAEMPCTMIRMNLVKGLGPVLQIAEGWTVNLPDDVSDTLMERTNPTWPCTWFAPRCDGKEGSPFKTAYEVMMNWGANHGAISYGHIGADLITMCSMLRIPVCMHNVPLDDIYRPACWNAFGMDKEGQDYRACATYGPLYK